MTYILFAQALQNFFKEILDEKEDEELGIEDVTFHGIMSIIYLMLKAFPLKGKWEEKKKVVNSVKATIDIVLDAKYLPSILKKKWKEIMIY